VLGQLDLGAAEVREAQIGNLEVHAFPYVTASSSGRRWWCGRACASAPLRDLPRIRRPAYRSDCQ
jgi:hypothetical protein